MANRRFSPNKSSSIFLEQPPIATVMWQSPWQGSDVFQSPFVKEPWPIGVSIRSGSCSLYPWVWLNPWKSPTVQDDAQASLFQMTLTCVWVCAPVTSWVRIHRHLNGFCRNFFYKPQVFCCCYCENQDTKLLCQIAIQASKFLLSVSIFFLSRLRSKKFSGHPLPPLQLPHSRIHWAAFQKSYLNIAYFFLVCVCACAFVCTYVCACVHASGTIHLHLLTSSYMLGALPACVAVHHMHAVPPGSQERALDFF